MKILSALTLLGLIGLQTPAAAQSSPTLDHVRANDEVLCGTNGQLAGFSTIDSSGTWIGLDVDFCRAIAAAVLGDAKKVRFLPMSSQQRFPAIQSGEINILSHTTTATLTREATVGMLFTGPTYYDGQGFLVTSDLGVTHAKQLDGATVCLRPGTTMELNLADFARAQGISLRSVVIEQQQQVVEAFLNGRCVAFTDDASGLASVRSEQPDPSSFTLLPELISKEPLGPAVRADDPRWFMIAKWVRDGWLTAEELGITAENVDEKLSSSDPSIQRLLGVSGDLGQALGLDNRWMYNVVKQIGNYGESFERNVGMSSPLQQQRGVNALWNAGGLMFANPVR